MRLKLLFKLSEPLLIALPILLSIAFVRLILIIGGKFWLAFEACSRYSPSDIIRCKECSESCEFLRSIF